MVSSLERYIDDAIREITRRDAGYLERFPIRFSGTDLVSPQCLSRLQLYSRPYHEACWALMSVIERCRHCGLNVIEAKEGPDPVASVLFDSAIDIIADRVKAMPIERLAGDEPTLSTILRENYHENRTPAGVRYFMNVHGQEPLLLINAVGVSLDIWSHFLGDRSHGFRIVVVESRSTDAIGGGMREFIELQQDVDDVESVLASANIGRTDVVAWCSGAKVALYLAARYPERVRSLVLASPSLRGAENTPERPTSFESGLEDIFATVNRHPARAAFFVKAVGQLTAAPDWERVANDPIERASVLFRLPAKKHAMALVTPMSLPKFLVNYARRAQAESGLSASAALRSINVPMLLISGDNDNIINNGFALAVLRSSAKDLIYAEIRGAGHYYHDLQYRYFRSLLMDFCRGEHPTESTRVQVNRISTQELTTGCMEGQRAKC